jgi:hypothetical protein
MMKQDETVVEDIRAARSGVKHCRSALASNQLQLIILPPRVDPPALCPWASWIIDSCGTPSRTDQEKLLIDDMSSKFFAIKSKSHS